MLVLPQETQIALVNYEKTDLIKLDHFKKCQQNKVINFSRCSKEIFAFTNQKRYIIPSSGNKYSSIEELI